MKTTLASLLYQTNGAEAFWTHVKVKRGAGAVSDRLLVLGKIKAFLDTANRQQSIKFNVQNP